MLNALAMKGFAMSLFFLAATIRNTSQDTTITRKYPAKIDYPRYANDLGEALATFTNPFTGQPLLPDFHYFGTDSNKKPIVHCYSQQCRECATLLLNGMKVTTPDSHFQEDIQEIMAKLGLDGTFNPDACRHSPFYQSKLTCPVKNPSVKEIQEFFKVIDANEPICPMRKYTETYTRQRLKRRQTSPVNLTIIICHLPGDRVATDTSYLHLCGSCFGIRFFGRNLFPSYGEEVFCHPRETSCLKSHCQCKENFISLTLTDRENRNRLNYSHSITVGCEPALKKLSALHSLVNI